MEGVRPRRQFLISSTTDFPCSSAQFQLGSPLVCFDLHALELLRARD
jgi:hypothetical protein